VSKLGDLTVTRLMLAVPRFGAWWADCLLSGEAAPTGTTTLVVGDLTMVGSVLRSGLDATGKPRAVFVGGAGWDKALTGPLSYQADVSVRLRTVLTDLTTRAGEPMEQPADRALDPHWCAVASTPRIPVRLRDVLSSLHRAGYVDRWRIDPDGVLRFGARAGVPVTGRATVIRRNLGLRKRVLGIDGPAQFLPGAIVDGVTVAGLYVHETSGKLEAEVYA
jgi:hypothetical protein